MTPSSRFARSSTGREQPRTASITVSFHIRPPSRIIGRNEKSRAQLVPLQDRQRHRAVVGIAVVERDREGAGRQALLAQARIASGSGSTLNQRFKQRELGVEPRRVRLPGEKGIRLAAIPDGRSSPEPPSRPPGDRHETANEFRQAHRVYSPRPIDRASSCTAERASSNSRIAPIQCSRRRNSNMRRACSRFSVTG